MSAVDTTHFVKIYAAKVRISFRITKKNTIRFLCESQFFLSKMQQMFGENEIKLQICKCKYISNQFYL